MSDRDRDRECVCGHAEIDHDPGCECTLRPDRRLCECEVFEPAYDDGVIRCDICGWDCQDRLGQVKPRCAQEYRAEREG